MGKQAHKYPVTEASYSTADVNEGPVLAADEVLDTLESTSNQLEDDNPVRGIMIGVSIGAAVWITAIGAYFALN